MTEIRNERARWTALAALAAVFFVATWLAGRTPGVWNSPDEMANAFWSERFARELPLFVQDPYVVLGRGVIHPRSFAVNGDALVPGSFPGLFLLYGAIKALFALPLEAITPLLSAAAGLLLYPVLRRLFDAGTAFLASVLWYVHPAVLYYAARGLYHNLLVLDLLIAAAAVFVLRPLKTAYGRAGWYDDAVGGALIGWAIAARASEAPWMLLGALAFVPLAGPDRWRRLGCAAAGAILPLLLFMSVNAMAHGAPTSTGYVVAPPAAEEAAVDQEAAAAPARAFALPFGFHPKAAARRVFEYGFGLFWWYAVPAAVGAWTFLRSYRRIDPAQRRYFWVAAGVSAWLAALYGSWKVVDRFDWQAVTIGTSYVRYFLPAYLLTLPFAAIGIRAIAAAARKPRAAYALAALAALLSVRSAFFAGDESLAAVRATIASNAAKRAQLLEVVPPGAVIVTERQDKVFFPERLRFVPIFDAAAEEILRELGGHVTLVWYGPKPTPEGEASLKARFAALGYGSFEAAPAPAGDALYFLKR